MPHFTVCVRVSSQALAAANGNLDAALQSMLAPYQENNMGDCPDEYLEFHDTEDEYASDYATKSSDMIKMPDGELVYTWDRRFQRPGTIGIGSDTHEPPPELERVTVAHKDRWSTLEEYAADYCGAKARDEETGRYGYWENPNAKWDWYAVGGRWSGFFPVKPGTEARVAPRRKPLFGLPEDEGPKPGCADIARVDQIDFDKVSLLMRESAEKFWGEWIRFLNGEKFDSFDGPRSKALSIGLLTVRRPGEMQPGELERSISWAAYVQPGDDRASWFDVYQRITRDAFLSTYLEAFSPIATFAVLDEEGWKAPGEMGWFGSSSDTPESYLESKRGFAAWLRADPDATVVVVDCHI